MMGPNESKLVAGLLATLAAMVVLVAGPARAAEGTRIQDVTTTDQGQVAFLLSAVGVQPGESIDGETLVVTIDGRTATATVDDASATESRSVLLVMDASGSMKGDRLAAAKEAGRQYLQTVPADVGVGLITFADDAAVVVPATTDRQAVEAALEGVVAEGSTALFDATALAVQELGLQGSRSIVLLSDGEDEGSAATESEALTALTQSGVALDAVAMTEGPGAEQLGRLAVAGDGVVARSNDPAALSAAFESAALTAAGQVLVTAELPAGISAGTYPLTATVDVAGTSLSDEAVVVVDAAAVEAASAANAAAAGPQPVEVRPIGLLQQAWFLPLLMLALFLSLAMIGVLAFRALSDDTLQPRRVQRRIDNYGLESAVVQAGQAGGDRAAVAQRAVAVAEQVVKDRDPDRVLERKLQASGVPMKPAEWVVMHASIIFTAGLLAAAFSGFSLAWTLIASATAALIPWLVLNMKARKRRAKFYEELPDVLQLLAGSVASGYSFPQAVDAVAVQTNGVASVEFQRATSEALLGIPIEDALSDVADRMDSRDFQWVVMAVRINRRVGGNLAEVLRTVATTLRERERVRRQVAALTAEGRLSAVILGLLPIVMTAYLAWVRPEYLGLLTSSVMGWFMVILGAVMLLVGFVWMRKMIRMEI